MTLELGQRRRIIVLAEDLEHADAKTAYGLIRYAPAKVLAVIDPKSAGRTIRDFLGATVPYDVPIIGDIDDASLWAESPEALVIGVAPTGGRLPKTFLETIKRALELGMDVHSGMHDFLSDDPELAETAAASGATIVDYRRIEGPRTTAVGRLHAPDKRIILTVGTDSSVGKMTVAMELRRAASANGRAAAVVPTGQTGMMIEGWGVAVDHVISDFVQGTAEWLVARAERDADWILVEGQGSIDHPAYSSVTVGLMHGTTPDAMVLVHKPGLVEHDFEHLPERAFPIADLASFIDIHERLADLIAPSKVVAVALNTSLIADEAEARATVARIRDETGLPCDDPVRFGATDLWNHIEAAVGVLPWVLARDRAPQTLLDA